MGYASRSGRAVTNPASPSAFGVCQRCSRWYNRNRLRNQFDVRGAGLLPTYIYVCDDCYDNPQWQLKAIALPADPVPVYQALPENFDQASNDYRTPSVIPTIDPITGLPFPPVNVRVTQDDSPRVTQQIGATRDISDAIGLSQGAQMPLVNTITWGKQIQLISVTANGTTTITVTCSVAHGLSTNSQISVEGLSNNDADGFFSVIVLSAMAFTYMTNKPVVSGPLLTGTTKMITANVGLPRNMAVIPQTGI